MKQGFWKRFLALVMAMAIVLSSGVLDSAGRLLANTGETEPTQETTAPTTPPSDQQGGTQTETLNVTTDPTGESGEPTGESSEPTGESSEPTGETTESTPQEVILTVVISAVFADESREGYVIATEVLTYGEGVESLTIEEEIPTVDGYTFAITGAAMVPNQEGKHVATFARPEESDLVYVTVTYSPVAPEGGEPSEPVEETDPSEPAEELTTTLIVSGWDMGGVETFEDAVYTFTWAEEETEKTVSFYVADKEGYAYLVDSEDYVSDGAGTYTGTIARPETSNTLYVDVYYRAVESVDPDEILPDTTPVATYTFTADGSVVSTQKVKDGETVYAPQAPQKDGYRFDGWYLGESLFVEGAASVSATETRAYVAKFTQVYYLFFADEQGRVKETHGLATGDTFDTEGYTILLDNKNLAITGWSLTPVDPNAGGDAVGTVTITDHNVVLYPITVTAFSITFDTQGGSFMDSVFYYGNETTVDPGEGATTRPGYMFRGWYTDKDCTTSYGFGQRLTQSITLYAKWEASQNTQYTIAYWIENANDTGHTFEGSVTASGTTGATIVLNNNQLSTNNISNSYRAYFHYDASKATSGYDQGLVIKGDGSTIVNVYFARNTYTLSFTISTNNGRTIRDQNDDNVNNLTTVPVVTIGGTTYTTTYSFTAKYEQDISELWPTAANVTTNPKKSNTTYYLRTIYGNNTSNTSKRVNLTKDLLSSTTNGSTTTFRFRWISSGTTYDLHYMLQPISGSTNHDNYIDSEGYRQLVTASSSTTWSAKDIAGFTEESSSGAKDSQNGSDGDRDVYFYYTRNRYDITFNNVNTKTTVEDIYYEADISGQNFTPDRPSGMDSVYEFQGWYTTEDCLEGSQFVWTGAKMPANNLILYAKWAAPGQGATIHFDIILENGSTTITVPYGELIADHLPEGYDSIEDLVQLSAGLTWDKQWLEVMSDGSFKAFFDVNAPITRPVKIAPNITSTESFNVSYDANGGTGSVTDSKNYYYGAYADVAYGTGLAKSGKVFLGWSKSASATSAEIQPGDRIQVPSDITLYAVWGDVPTATSLTYDANGGATADGKTSKTYAFANNDTAVVEAVTTLGFTRAGYRFLGWSKSASATSAEYAAGANILVDSKGSNVLYAVWEQVEFNVTYSYTGTVPAGVPEAPAAVKKTMGETVTVEAAPTMAGYTFSGWKTTDTTVSGGSFTMPENDVAFTGSWTIRSDLQYTVNYYLNGTTTKVADSKTVTGQTFGASVTESAIDISGYTKVAPTSATITVAESGNVINFYYYQNVTLTAQNGSAKYDGTEHSASGYTASVSGAAFSGITASGKGTDAGEYPVNFSDGAVGTVSDDGKYIVTAVTPGTLSIAKRAVTLTSGTSSREFNGAALTNETVTVSGDGFVTGQGVDSYSGFPSITYPGSVSNTFSYTLNAATNADNYAITTVPGTLTVTDRSVKYEIVLEAQSATYTYDGTAKTAEGIKKLSFTFDGVTYTVSGVSASQTQTNVGSYTVAVTGTPVVTDAAGNVVTGQFSISRVDGTLKIDPATMTLTATGYKGMYDGQSHAATASCSVASATISWSVDNVNWSATAPSVKDVADGVVTVYVKAEDPNYVTVTASCTLEVTKRTVTITSDSAEKVYDGQPLVKHSVTVTGDGFVSGEGATYSYTGTQTDVGSSANTFTYQLTDATKAGNYTITTANGTLKVTKSGTLTVDGTDYTGVYDGKAHGEAGVPSVTEGTTLTYSVDGGAYSSTVPTITDVGSHTVTVKAVNPNYEDATDTYTLTVTPAAVTVTVVGATEEGIFKGSAYTATGYDISDDHALYDLSAVTFSGTDSVSRTDVGTSPMGLAAEQFGNSDPNFTVTFAVTDGSVTVTPKAVTVTANDKSKVYGEDDPTLDATVTGLVGSDTLSYTVTREEGEDVGEYVITPSGADVQGNYTVSYVPGTLEITKRAVTVTVVGNSAAKTYNGSEQSVEGFASVTISDDKYTEDKFTAPEAIAKGIAVGEYPMGLTESQFVNNDANFDVTFVVTDGKLTISAEDSVVVVIRGKTYEGIYDGESHTVTGYEVVSISSELYTVADFTGPATKSVSRTNVGETKQGLTAADFVNTNTNFANVTFQVTDGYVKIDPLAITVTIVGETDSKVYNGSEQSVTGYDVTISNSLYTESDFTYSGDKTAKGTAVGTYPMGLKEADFTNNNSNFTVTFDVTDGSLEITKKAITVTIVGETGSKVYNGSEQSVTGYDVTISDPLYLESYFTYSGDKTAKGTDVGTYPMGLAESQFVNDDANFDVTFVVTDGSLEITPLAIDVTIVGETDSKVYNGSEQSVTGYDVTISNSLYTEADFTFTGDDTAKGTDVGTYPMGLAKEQFVNGNDNFTVTFTVTDGSLEITRKAITVTIVGETDSKVYNGAEQSVTGYDVTISDSLYTEDKFTFSGEDTAKGTDVGTYPMGLAEAQFVNDDANFDVTFTVTDGSLEITKRSVTLTSATDSKQYDGTALTNSEITVTGDGFVSGEGYTASVTGTQTDVGSSQNTFTYTLNEGTKASNYDITTAFGTLTVTNRDAKFEVTVEANSGTFTYDGSAKTVSGLVNTQFTFNGVTYTVYGLTAENTQTDVGTYPVNVVGTPVVRDAKGTDVTSQFAVSTKAGTLEIEPLEVTVTVTGNTGSKIYNGSEQTVEGYTWTATSALFKESDFVFHGDDTARGTDIGTYPMGLAVAQFEAVDPNFDVTFVVNDGQLEITPLAITVTVTENSDTKVYNGAEQSVEDYTWTATSALYTASDFSFSGEAIAKGTDVGKYDMAVEETDFTNLNTNFTVTFTVVDGQLEITPVTDKVTVTVTENSGSELYDGTEKTVEGYEVTSISNSLYTESDFTFSGTDSVSGTDADTYEMELKSADFTNISDNFTNVEFVIVDGELEITKRSVTLTSADAEKIYDGTALTDATVTVTGDGFVSGEGAAYDVTGSQTAEGSSDNTFTYTLNEGTKASNYDIQVVYGTLTVTALTDEIVVTITEHSGEYLYDGETKTVNGYDVSISSGLYTEDDFTFSGTASVSGTDAGTYEMELKASDFQNISENFTNVTFVIVDGDLEISKRSVTLTSADDSKVYDGTALTNDEITVTGDGFAKNEGAAYDVTGSQTETGSSDNTFTYALTDGTKAANYDITVVFGTLEVTPVTDEVVVTVTEHSGSYVYDSNVKTVEGYDVSISNDLYTEADFTFSGTDSVSGTDVGTYDMELKASDFANISENFTNVTFVIVDGRLEITKRPVTVTVTGNSDSKIYNGAEQSVEDYEVAISDALYTEADFTFSGEAIAKGTDVGNYPMGLAVDQFTNDDANFEVTFVVTDGALDITPVTSKVTVTITEHSGSYMYDGQSKTVEGYDVDISNALYTASDFTFSGTDSVSGTDADTYEMELKSADFTNISDNFTNVEFVIVDGELEITKRSVTLTSADADKIYDGTALTDATVTVTGDGFVSGEGAAYDVTGSQTAEGSSDNTFTYTLNEGTKASNYDIQVVYGTLTVSALTDEIVVTITEHSGTNKYDGETKTVNGYDVSISNSLYTEADFTFSGSAFVSGTDVGSYDMELKPEDFTNISENFTNVTFVIVDGTLEITKRNVTLTSGTSAKTYDGNALTNHSVTVSGDGFAKGESFTANVTGSQTEVGSSANAFTYELTGNAKAGNYEITQVEGTLTINPLTDKITVTITEHSGSYMYDGQVKTVSGYDVSISNKLYTEADFTFGGTDSVSGTDVGTYEMELKPEDFTNISKNFTNVEFVIVDGTLEITKRSVTLTSADDSKVYDGTALTNDEITVTGDGFASGEGAAYDVTGSQTEKGASDNIFTYTLNDGTKAGNYDITVVLGTLEVTALTEEVVVTITEHSGSYVYDGEQKTVDGYDVSISNKLYTEADFTFSGTDSVSGTDAGTYQMGLKPEHFVNTSSNFANVTFVIVDGELEITKRPVTLTSADDSKEYDGTALTNDTVEITDGSFAPGEGYAATVKGSQTLVGTSENHFTYTLTGNGKDDNYEITVVFGTLEVTDRAEPFTMELVANSGTYEYDGTEKVVEGFESLTGTGITGDPETLTFTLNGATFTISGLSAYEAQTDVAPAPRAVYQEPYSFYNVEVEGTYVITDATGADVTAQFTLTTVDGKLTITPKAVTMVSADAEKPYDGTALTDPTVTVNGFVTGEGAAYDVTGTQTLIGSSENVFDFTLNANTKAQNYVIETTFGTLTVTPPEDFEIVDKSHKAEGNYRLGDTVTFDITVKNIFSEEANVEIREQEGVSILWNGSKVQSVKTTIPAGESITLQAEYIIQEKDILAGEFTNVVDVKIDAVVDKIPYNGEDDDDDVVDEIEDPKPHLTLDKVTISTPAAENGKYVVGEKIVYQITATNDGNLTLHDIVITDSMTGIARGSGVVETFTVPGELAPGESYSFTYEYTVVEEDLQKTLVNAVTGEAGNSSETDDDDRNDTPTEVVPDQVEDVTDDIRRDLQVEKEVLNKLDEYRLYSYVEYEITIVNNGNVTERDVLVTDIMDAQGKPERFSFTDLGGGLLLPGNQVEIPAIAPGATVTILCRYQIDGKDEALQVGNKVIIESSDGEVTDEDEAEKITVEKLYNLTIYYLSDDWQLVMAPEYHGRYRVGAVYYVESPVIDGYVANYLVIGSGYVGMPANDVVAYVLYTKLPEETTLPSEPTDPTDPSETTEPTTAPTEPTYDLTEIPEDPVPLGNLGLGDHTCCIMHFLIMLVAMVVLGFYTKDRKKYQERIHELRRAMASEDAAAAIAGEEQA